MSFARELAEAVEAPSIPEQVSFLDLLDEQVTTALYTGNFTEQVMEKALVVILRESGFEPGDEDEVFEAIDEFLNEELDAFDEGMFDALKAMAGDAVKGAAKDVAKAASKDASKRITKIKTKSKTGKMLKHAAAGAVKQIGNNPKDAKKILKKTVTKAGKKILRGAAKKGMKMVFGKWLKTEHEETLALDERRRSSKRAEIEKAFAKRGSIRMPRLDKNEYPPIRGMEGPFQFRDGRTLYYDPREGRYYDRKTDMYLARNDIPEDQQEMLAALVEVDGYDEYTVLTEAVLTKSLAPVFDRAMGVEMDKRQAKLVVNEFVQKFRQAVEQKLYDEGTQPEVDDHEKVEFEYEGEYIPAGKSTTSMDGPSYWARDFSKSDTYWLPIKMSQWWQTGIGVPDAVDLMAGTLKRLFGNDAFISARKNLARALLSNKKVFLRLVTETVNMVLRSWKWDDLNTDLWHKEIEDNIFNDLSSREWTIDDIGKYAVYLKKVEVQTNKMKPVSSTAGPGSDVYVSIRSYWTMKVLDYPEIIYDA